jgi:hypothetical protein
MGQPAGLAAQAVGKFRRPAILADALNQLPDCMPNGENRGDSPVEKDTRKPSLLPAGGWVVRIGPLHSLRMPQRSRVVTFYLGTSGLPAVGTLGSESLQEAAVRNPIWPSW